MGSHAHQDLGLGAGRGVLGGRREEGPERPTARIASAQSVQNQAKSQARANGQVQTKPKGFALSPRLLAELDKAEDFALSNSLLAEIDTAAKKEKKRNRKS